jgi:hypothetical protein
VECLPGEIFSYVLDVFFGYVYTLSKSGVDLAVETFTGQGFLDELFPDCFKSELIKLRSPTSQINSSFITKMKKEAGDFVLK